MLISTIVIGFLLGASAAAVLYIAYLTLRHIRDWFRAKTEGLSKKTIENLVEVIVNSTKEDAVDLGIIDRRDNEVISAQRLKFDSLDPEVRERLRNKDFITI